jgi:hypothetical protein
MTTTLDLPDALVEQVEARALHEGRELKDVAADLLRIGLAGASDPLAAKAPPLLKAHPLTGAPYYECAADAPARHLTTDQLLALERETQTEEDLERLGLPPRR